MKLPSVDAVDPLAVPAGPERRRLLAEQGMNVGRDDFTPAELERLAADSAEDGLL